MIYSRMMGNSEWLEGWREGKATGDEDGKVFRGQPMKTLEIPAQELTILCVWGVLREMLSRDLLPVWTGHRSWALHRWDVCGKVQLKFLGTFTKWEHGWTKKPNPHWSLLIIISNTCDLCGLSLKVFQVLRHDLFGPSRSCHSNDLGVWLTTLSCHIILSFLSPSYLFLSMSSNFCLVFLSSSLSQTTTHIIFIALFRTNLCLSSSLFIEKGSRPETVWRQGCALYVICAPPLHRDVFPGTAIPFPALQSSWKIDDRTQR